MTATHVEDERVKLQQEVGFSVERRDPLFVQLESFTAERVEDGVLLRWTTSAEIDNAGFRILRASASQREKSPVVISDPVILAAGNDIVGADYEYLDREKLGGVVHYYLQDIDVYGTTTLHGPVTIESPGPGSRTAPGMRTDPRR